MAIRVTFQWDQPGQMFTLAEVRDRIARALSSKERIWVDLEDPTEEEVSVLRHVFRFHSLAIEDCLYGLQRPKVDEYGDYMFLVLHSISRASRGAIYVPSEFDVFISENYLVTFHSEEFPQFREIAKDFANPSVWKGRSTGYLLYHIIKQLEDGYFPLIDRVDEHLQTIENQVIRKPDQKFLEQVFSLRRAVIRIRKSLSPQREVLNHLLRRDQPFITTEDRAYLLDAYDQVLRLLDFTDNLHDLLSNVLDAYLSATSNRLNEVMKVLTIISTIMMPLSLIASIYGMNFKYMPELEWKIGYPLALAAMVAVTVGMLAFFRKRGWL